MKHLERAVHRGFWFLPAWGGGGGGRLSFSCKVAIHLFSVIAAFRLVPRPVTTVFIL